MGGESQGVSQGEAKQPPTTADAQRRLSAPVHIPRWTSPNSASVHPDTAVPQLSQNGSDGMSGMGGQSQCDRDRTTVHSPPAPDTMSHGPASAAAADRGLTGSLGGGEGGRGVSYSIWQRPVCT